MRRFFRYLLRALVLVVVFMASALLAMRFAIHGRQTTIPKVVGLSHSQAEKLLADHGLVLEQGDRYFSSDVASGRVMSQAPQPGAQVRRGWHVRVAESMGPQRVVIPDLLGNSERAAEINIRRRALYTSRAQQRNVSVNEMAAAVACEIFQGRIAVGERYRDEGGQWRQRTASQPVSMPSFCP